MRTFGAQFAFARIDFDGLYHDHFVYGLLRRDFMPGAAEGMTQAA